MVKRMEKEINVNKMISINMTSMRFFESFKEPGKLHMEKKNGMDNNN